MKQNRTKSMPLSALLNDFVLPANLHCATDYSNPLLNKLDMFEERNFVLSSDLALESAGCFQFKSLRIFIFNKLKLAEFWNPLHVFLPSNNQFCFL